MKNLIQLLFILFTLIAILTGCKSNKTTHVSKEEEKMYSFIDSMVKEMTLEEKIGQLNLLSSSGDIVTGQARSSDVILKIKQGKIGALLNVKSVEKIKKIQQIAVEQSRLKIPLLFGLDVIHGYETTFPIPLGLSCTWDMELIEQTARTAAREATADGLNWTFSPMVDICKDARWGRIAEGAGEDAYLGSEVAKAMVRGYQGNDLKKNSTILSCVKHIALYGASESGRDYNTVDMGRVRMYNEYFPPYKAAVDAGAGSAMSAFNEVDGLPATGNKWLLTEVLRDQWNFNGFVVSDYTSVSEMMAHGLGDDANVAALALKAGCDMEMVGEKYLGTFKNSLKQKRITIKDIEKATKRILVAKYKLGLFDDPYKYCNIERAAKEIFNKTNRAFARKAAAESMVLLKNTNNILPLAKRGTIALVGPLANASENMAGPWSMATKHEKSVSLLQGLKKVLGKKVRIRYAKGSNVVYDAALEKRITTFGNTVKAINRDGRSARQLRDEAVKVARRADVIVAAIGEASEMSGESSSRTNLRIPKAQRDLLKALQKTGKPIVLVLFTGRPLNLVIEQGNKNISAILNVWFPGSEAGLAIADILFGDAHPAGNLTTSFPRNVGQVPLYYNYKNTGRPISNTQGKYEQFRSNYLDIRNEPLYPFGYGLSYTSFTYSNLKLSETKLTKNDSILVSIDVTNTGKYDGKETVQLYIRDMVGSITRPVKELKGFKKIFIKKGQTQTVAFTLKVEDLKFYNQNLDFVAEPGEFRVFVGANSQDVLEAKFWLK